MFQVTSGGQSIIARFTGLTGLGQDRGGIKHAENLEPRVIVQRPEILMVTNFLFLNRTLQFYGFMLVLIFPAGVKNMLGNDCHSSR